MSAHKTIVRFRGRTASHVAREYEGLTIFQSAEQFVWDVVRPVRCNTPIPVRVEYPDGRVFHVDVEVTVNLKAHCPAERAFREREKKAEAILESNAV